MPVGDYKGTINFDKPIKQTNEAAYFVRRKCGISRVRQKSHNSLNFI